ncbi:MAG: glycoside hydrolase/phage tail family protein [Pseudomonadota bacterium]
MAQIALTQLGATLGASLAPGGIGFLGATISGASLGGALGGIAGAAIDGALFGRGAQGPRLTHLHVMESREGAGVPLVYGRYRVGGQVIWAGRFREQEETEGGKGGPRVTTFSYSASFAVGLGQGGVTRIARVWANGEPLALGDVAHRFYSGSETQDPDPLIEAEEGFGCAPAYRGLSYVVFEDLPLDQFGNRLPQLSFEIIREPAQSGGGLKSLLTGVNIIPASGEFVYDTQIVRAAVSPGVEPPQNMNNGDGRADFVVSLDQMEADLPAVETAALTVGWFGNDLRAGLCEIRPGVEQAEKRTKPYDWTSGGVDRGGVWLISKDETDAPYYGGTPSDQAVVHGIQALKARGIRVTMSPFLFMDVPPGNGLPDPYGGAEQAPFPWRGRITLAGADKSAAARAEIESFVGSVSATAFSIAGETVAYHGPAGDWGYRRFVLHQAWLAKAAGGVDAFLIGSELRGLTRLRDETGAFPFVEALRALAADVKAVLGAETEVSYAADWTEYGAYVPGDGDVLFPLDALWADANVDFVGVDWYPPAGDWRDGFDHLDAEAGFAAADQPAYLAANMAGGEAYDWFYGSDADRQAQVRTPIADTAHGEHWVFRQKDLEGWWSAAHHERPGGVRNAAPTAWTPGMKPVRLSEIGFPAVDKGANSPNLFYDPKSAESALPPFSSGDRDDVLQRRALEAALAFWGGKSFVDEVLVWTWDARPWPAFPTLRSVWSDGSNWAFGHWLNGRAGLVELADVAADLAALAGVEADTARLSGVVEGFALAGVTTLRGALEPLKAAFDFHGVEREGGLVFRSFGDAAELSADVIAGDGPVFERGLLDKAPEAIRLTYVDAGGDQTPAVAWAQIDGGDSRLSADLTTPLAMGAGRAAVMAHDVLARLRRREAADVQMSTAALDLEPGDLVELGGVPGDWRVFAVTGGEAASIRLERRAAVSAARSIDAPDTAAQAADFGDVDVVVVDAPALPGEEADARPLVGAFARPWPGRVQVYAGVDAGSETRRCELTRAASVGRLIEPLAPGPVGRWDYGARLVLETNAAGFTSADGQAVLSGANGAFVETGAGWELLQFASVEQTGAETYVLSGLLRGQQGSPSTGAPIGARCVLNTGALVRADIAPGELELERSWRAEARGVFGPAQTEVWRSAATLPWRPAHLRATALPGGGRHVSWTRRDVSIGDGWATPEADNLGRFRVEAVAGGVVVRSEDVDAAEWIYADAAADGADIVRVAGIGPDGRTGAFVEIPL